MRPIPSCSARCAARPWRRTAGWPGRQPLDLDVLPADPAHAQAQHLGDGLLGRPAPGEGLGSSRGRSAAPAAVSTRLREPLAEPLDRRPDPLDLDDVDAELGRALGHDAHGQARIGVRAGGRHPLLDRHRLGEVARLVHVGAAGDRHVVGEQLERDDRQHGRQRPRGCRAPTARRPRSARWPASPSVATAITRASRARPSMTLLISLS